MNIKKHNNQLTKQMIQRYNMGSVNQIINIQKPKKNI